MAKPSCALEEARSAGATRYFTGKPCKRGHIAERNVRNKTCLECLKLAPANQPERQAERGANWRALNAKHKTQAWAEWKRNNADKVKASAARYWRTNRERLAGTGSKWRKENPGRAKEVRIRWMGANRARLAEVRARRRAALLHATVAWADKKMMAQFYKEAAEMTRTTGIHHEVDHVVPIVSRHVCGLHVEFNLRVTTESENRRKSNRFSPGPLDG